MLPKLPPGLASNEPPTRRGPPRCSCRDPARRRWRGAGAARSPAGACRAGGGSGSKSPPSRRVRSIPAPGFPPGRPVPDSIASRLRPARRKRYAAPPPMPDPLYAPKPAACHTPSRRAPARPPGPRSTSRPMPRLRSTAASEGRRSEPLRGVPGGSRSPCRGRPARSAARRSPPTPSQRTTAAADAAGTRRLRPPARALELPPAARRRGAGTELRPPGLSRTPSRDRAGRRASATGSPASTWLSPYRSTGAAA